MHAEQYVESSSTSAVSEENNSDQQEEGHSGGDGRGGGRGRSQGRRGGCAGRPSGRGSGQGQQGRRRKKRGMSLLSMVCTMSARAHTHSALYIVDPFNMTPFAQACMLSCCQQFDIFTDSH